MKLTFVDGQSDETEDNILQFSPILELGFAVQHIDVRTEGIFGLDVTSFDELEHYGFNLRRHIGVKSIAMIF